MQVRWFRTNVLRNSLAITIEHLGMGQMNSHGKSVDHEPRVKGMIAAFD